MDPLFFLLPLFDAYAGPARARNMDNPRLSPTLASLDSLPRNMLFIVPTLDILLEEQLSMVKRLQDEASTDPAHSKRRIECMTFEKQIHGWAERRLLGMVLFMLTRTVPDAIAGKSKEVALQAGVTFIKDVHRDLGWEWP